MANINISDLLLQIKSINEAILLQHELAIPNHLPISKSVAAPIPQLLLDVPSLQGISAQLEDHGTPSLVAHELASIHVNRCSELASRYTAMHAKTCQELARIWHISPSGHLNGLYTRIGRLQETYYLQVDAWLQDLVERVHEQFEAAPVRPASSRRRPFNQDYVSTLEAFFEKNSYPSRADRVHLAKKSGMALRQINVWFQNKRRRSRQAGAKFEPLDCSNSSTAEQRTYFPDTPNPQLDYETTTNPPSVISDGEETDIEDYPEDQQTWSRASSFTLVPDDPPFTYEIPEYAFPAVYPPPLDYDPFPCRTRPFSCPKLIWMRARRLVAAPTDFVVDINSLTSAFEGIRIDDNGVPSKDLGRRAKEPYASAAMMITTTYTAPLPSFIRPIHRRNAVYPPYKPYQGTYTRQTIPSAKSTKRYPTHRATVEASGFPNNLYPASKEWTSLRKASPFPHQIPKHRTKWRNALAGTGDNSVPQLTRSPSASESSSPPSPTASPSVSPVVYIADSMSFSLQDFV